MDKHEVAKQIAQLLLDYSPDPRSFLDPLLLMLAELEKKLYWDRDKTPALSHFVRIITFLDLLDAAINKWFESGEWPYDDRNFQRLGGPRLQKVDPYSEDLISQLLPNWLMARWTLKHAHEKEQGDIADSNPEVSSKLENISAIIPPESKVKPIDVTGEIPPPVDPETDV